MSTKNLARTAIEGGRTGSNKWDRNYSHKETRADERAYLKEVTTDTENWYEYDIEPTRPVHKEFNDKLGPVQRWLSSQVGRLWNDVRSDIAEKFDTRTTAGRHIVEDHMLGQVEEVPDLRYRSSRNYSGKLANHESHRRDELYVDSDGYLQHKIYVPRNNYPKLPAIDYNQLSNWLNGKIVGKVGDKLYWFIPVNVNNILVKWQPYYSTWKYPSQAERSLSYFYLTQEPVYKTDSVGRTIVDGLNQPIVEGHREVWKSLSSVSFRQYRKLNDKELAFWKTIPEVYQNGIVACSPTAPKLPKKKYPAY